METNPYVKDNIVNKIQGMCEEIIIDKLVTYEDYHKLAIDCINHSQSDYQWLFLGGNVECLYIHIHGAQTLKEVIEMAGTEIFEISYVEKINDISAKNLEKMMDYNLDYNLDYKAFSILQNCLLKNENGTCIESPQQLFMRVAIATCWPDVKTIKCLYNDLSSFHYTLNLEVMKHAGIRRKSDLPSNKSRKSTEDLLGSLQETKFVSLPDVFIEKFIEGDPVRCFDEDKNRKLEAVYGLEYRQLYEYYTNKIAQISGNSTEDRVESHTEDYAESRVESRVESQAEIPVKHFDLNPKKIIKKITNQMAKNTKPSPVLYRDTIYKKCNGTCPGTNLITEKTFNLGVINLDSCVSCRGNSFPAGPLENPTTVSKELDIVPLDSQTKSGLDLPPTDASHQGKRFNFKTLSCLTSRLVKTLNRVLDYYDRENKDYLPNEQREIFISVQGLADTFIKLDLDFDSPESGILNKIIFETIYYNFVKTSSNLARRFGKHQNFSETSLAKGMMCFDLWARERAEKASKKIDPLTWKKPIYTSNRYDWGNIRSQVMINGMRNSGEICIIPLKKLSAISGNTPGVEPLNNFFNLNVRKELFGELPSEEGKQSIKIVNKYLSAEFKKYNMWNDPESMTEAVKSSDGSLNRFEINEDSQPLDKVIGLKRIKSLFRPGPLILRKHIIDMAIDRGPFITGFQYFNTYMKGINFRKIKSIINYSWNRGLKSSLYQLIEFNPNPSTYSII